MKERLRSQIEKIKTYAEQVGALRATIDHPKRGEDIESLNIQLQRAASGLERSYNRALSIIEQIPAE